MASNNEVRILTAVGERKLASNTGTDTRHRPVHHSEILTMQVAKTRPNDTTPYAAGDVQGAASDVVFSFNIGAAGYSGALIIGARLIRKDVTNTAQRHRLMIHDEVPASLTNADNAAHPLLWANRTSRRGWIDFASPVLSDASGGDVAEFQGALSNVQGIAVAPADGIVRCVLVTRDAFTPAALTDFAIELDFIA